MKIEIELKPRSARRIGVVAATLTVLGLAAVVYANQVHFSSGQTLTAAALNGNFDELYAAVAKPTVTKNGKSISIGGSYCGASATSYNGSQVGGYTGAKAKCESTCASTTAHLCDAAEITRSKQLGLTLADGSWVAGFTSTNTPSDCISWTSGLSNAWATVLSLSPPALLLVDCTTSHALACCD